MRRRKQRRTQYLAFWTTPCSLVLWAEPLGGRNYLGSLSGLSHFRRNLMILVQMGVIARRISGVSVMPVKAKGGQDPNRGENMRPWNESERADYGLPSCYCQHNRKLQKSATDFENKRWTQAWNDITLQHHRPKLTILPCFLRMTQDVCFLGTL